MSPFPSSVLGEEILLEPDAFDLHERALDADPARVAAEGAAGGDHPVARDDDRDGVSPERVTLMA